MIFWDSLSKELQIFILGQATVIVAFIFNAIRNDYNRWKQATLLYGYYINLINEAVNVCGKQNKAYKKAITTLTGFPHNIDSLEKYSFLELEILENRIDFEKYYIELLKLTKNRKESIDAFNTIRKQVNYCRSVMEDITRQWEIFINLEKEKNDRFLSIFEIMRTDLFGSDLQNNNEHQLDSVIIDIDFVIRNINLPSVTTEQIPHLNSTFVAPTLQRVLRMFGTGRIEYQKYIRPLSEMNIAVIHKAEKNMEFVKFLSNYNKGIKRAVRKIESAKTDLPTEYNGELAQLGRYIVYRFSF